MLLLTELVANQSAALHEMRYRASTGIEIDGLPSRGGDSGGASVERGREAGLVTGEEGLLPTDPKVLLKLHMGIPNFF